MNPGEKFIIRKKELFSQVTELINKIGFENITIRGICQSLNISTGSFYHYFSDKSDLILILFEDIDEYFQNDVAKSFNDDEYSNLLTFTDHYGKYVINNGVGTCRCISMAPLKSGHINYLEEKRGIFLVLNDILRRGISKKQFPPEINPEETTRMILIVLRGYSADWAKHNGDYDLCEAITRFMSVFIKSISI